MSPVPKMHPSWRPFFGTCAHPATCRIAGVHGRYNAESETFAFDYAKLLADMAMPEETRPPEANEVWALFVTYQLTGGGS